MLTQFPPPVFFSPLVTKKHRVPISLVLGYQPQSATV